MTIPIFMQTNVAIRAEHPSLRPLRAHPSDAGADLFSNSYDIIHPGTQSLIDTGVAVQIPVGFVGLVYNRSSQGKIGIQLANSVGVIDSDYRGNIKVLLKNNGEIPYVINAQETRIAQLVITPIVLAHFGDFTGTDEEWNNTKRGTGGFGSTGT